MVHRSSVHYWNPKLAVLLCHDILLHIATRNMLPGYQSQLHASHQLLPHKRCDQIVMVLIIYFFNPRPNRPPGSELRTPHKIVATTFYIVLAAFRKLGCSRERNGELAGCVVEEEVGPTPWDGSTTVALYVVGKTQSPLILVPVCVCVFSSLRTSPPFKLVTSYNVDVYDYSSYLRIRLTGRMLFSILDAPVHAWSFGLRSA